MQQQIIENALALCGKTMEDMTETYIFWNTIVKERFSIEKFWWYLLGPEFIYEYLEEIDYENNPDYCDDEYPKWYAYSQFWVAIWEYQRRDEEFPDWNEQPLIELLTKIKW